MPVAHQKMAIELGVRVDHDQQLDHLLNVIQVTDGFFDAGQAVDRRQLGGRVALLTVTSRPNLTGFRTLPSSWWRRWPAANIRLPVRIVRTKLAVGAVASPNSRPMSVILCSIRIVNC